jgi:hypothetical protein
VPSASIPGIQQRYCELQPAALATLCSLLQSLSCGLPAAAAAAGDRRTLPLAAKALRGLRHALSDVNRLPEEQGISSAAIAGLLFEFVGAARLAPAGGCCDGEEAALQVAAAAMDCVTDLQAKYFGAEATAQMLEVLVPRLQASRRCRPLARLTCNLYAALSCIHAGGWQVLLPTSLLARIMPSKPLITASHPHPPSLKDTCALVQQRWTQQGGQFSAEDSLLTSFVRLLAQFFTTQLRCQAPLPACCARNQLQAEAALAWPSWWSEVD